MALYSNERWDNLHNIWRWVQNMFSLSMDLWSTRPLPLAYLGSIHGVLHTMSCIIWQKQQLWEQLRHPPSPEWQASPTRWKMTSAPLLKAAQQRCCSGLMPPHMLLTVAGGAQGSQHGQAGSPVLLPDLPVAGRGVPSSGTWPCDTEQGRQSFSWELCIPPQPGASASPAEDHHTAGDWGPYLCQHARHRLTELSHK